MSGDLALHEALFIHSDDYSSSELLLGSDIIEELELTPVDFVEIVSQREEAPAAAAAHPSQGALNMVADVRGQSMDLRGQPLILRAPASASSAKGALRVSLHRSVADAFSFTARQAVTLRRVSVQAVSVEWVELSFKDQQLSRGDIWHFRRHLINHVPTLRVGKTVSFAGVRAQVYRMMMGGAPAASGVLTEQTKLRFRSRSAAFVLLIQVSSEMGGFDAAGERYDEKAIRFLRALFRRWKALGVSHSLSIALFCRCYAEATPEDYEPSGAGVPAAGPAPPPLATAAAASGTAQSSLPAAAVGPLQPPGSLPAAPIAGAASGPASSLPDAKGGGGGVSGGGGVGGGVGSGVGGGVGSGGGSGAGPAAELCTDRLGRRYSDYYKLVAENEVSCYSPLIWGQLLFPPHMGSAAIPPSYGDGTSCYSPLIWGWNPMRPPTSPDLRLLRVVGREPLMRP